MAVAEQAGRLRDTVLEFESVDGLPLNLIHVQGDDTPTKRPVVLVHGAGVRANICRAPVETNLVDYLVANGYDVWLENWRASIDFPQNQWTLDKAALYDHPVAVKRIVEETGAESIKAVIHCQGSTSFMVSAVAGLLPQVSTIVSNAVSLHPVIPRLSTIKLNFLLRCFGWLYPYMDPRWGLKAPTIPAKLLALVVKLSHHECDNNVCKFSSFVYGIGFPTLWRHENLNEATHEWVNQEFGAVPRTFFDQITKSVGKGKLVPIDSLDGLPSEFVPPSPGTDARFAFIAGVLNRCFSKESQELTFAYFNSHRPNYHTLRLIPDYGHLDIFMGQNAVNDTFPIIMEELDRAV